MNLQSTRRRRPLAGITTIIALFTLIGPALAADSRQDEQLNSATIVLNELRAIPESAIPPALLDRAYAIAIIPDMIKIGVGIAGRHGSGVMTVRQPDGWSPPVFIKLSGGSVGWQAGLQTSDLVLVFTNERGVQNITRGKLTLGADASIAAGPVGRHTSAATDGRFRAEVYSYSRARGLFAGVSVEGASLRIDDKANAAYYVAPAITADAIIAGQVDRVPDSAVSFRRSLPGANRAEADNAGTDATAALVEETAEDAPAKTFAMGEQPASEQE